MNLHIQLLLALGAVVAELEVSKSKLAAKTLAMLHVEHVEVSQLVTEHGILCRLHRRAAPPFTLDLPEFLNCVEATGLTVQDLDAGFRPCIAEAGRDGPRYCYMRPSGALHMGPSVSSF